MALPYQLTKTLTGAILELEGVTDTIRREFLNSTLNSKYDVDPDTLPTASPKIAYFGIGINGKKNLDENLSAPYIPSPANMDIFEPVPFRVVPTDADLTASEKSNYRMRVMRTFDGIDYWCYYLKRLTILANQVKIISTEIASGVETDIDVLDPNNLTPVPGNTTAEGAAAGTDRLSVVLDAEMRITGAEVVEAINVLYSGNLLKAHISEIGIYSGEDKNISAPDGLGGTISYDESIYTQLQYHYTNLGSDYSDMSRIEDVKLRLSSSKAFII